MLPREQAKTTECTPPHLPRIHYIILNVKPKRIITPFIRKYFTDEKQLF